MKVGYRLGYKVGYTVYWAFRMVLKYGNDTSPNRACRPAGVVDTPTVFRTGEIKCAVSPYTFPRRSGSGAHGRTLDLSGGIRGGALGGADNRTAQTPKKVYHTGAVNPRVDVICISRLAQSRIATRKNFARNPPPDLGISTAKIYF